VQAQHHRDTTTTTITATQRTGMTNEKNDLHGRGFW
jgi:hypothetical protein